MILVLATILTGYLAEVNWHLPFIVYLFPLISIVLSFYLKKNISPYPDTSMHATVKPVASQAEMKPAYGTTDNSFGKFGIQIRHLMQIMAFYGLATYLGDYHQFQPTVPDERVSFHQRKFGYHDLSFFLSYHGTGIHT